MGRGGNEEREENGGGIGKGGIGGRGLGKNEKGNVGGGKEGKGLEEGEEEGKERRRECRRNRWQEKTHNGSEGEGINSTVLLNTLLHSSRM